MTSLDRHRDVIQMAADLKLDWRGGPTSAILEYCHARIAGWTQEAPRLGSLQDLEELVCAKLGLVFEEFRTDGELDAIVARYVAMGEYVFAAQRDEFDADTYAALIRRDGATPDCSDRFVALIDCRGQKVARRFFTRWHEIAHLLTLVDGQMEIPFHRSTADRDPIEQLMDKIAADIGFYDPIFRPAVEEAVSGAGSLSLDLVEEIRRFNCPAASFQATLIATVNRAPVPAISLEAGPGLKKSEERHSRNGSLFPELAPQPKLRVLNIGGNEAARIAKLRVHRNMRVPTTSIIARLHESGADSGEARAIESLDEWVTSDGQMVGDQEVEIDARLHGDRVIALMVLVG